MIFTREELFDMSPSYEDRRVVLDFLRTLRKLGIASHELEDDVYSSCLMGG